MKKVFPLIVVLISLSVVGILFIQMSWINNAIKLKHEEFLRAVNNSLKGSADAMQNQFISKQKEVPVGSASRRFLLEQNFTTQTWFTKEELAGIIQGALKENGIKRPFEFCILDMFKNPVFVSDGFHGEDMEDAFPIGLATDNNSMNQETLYLSIHEDKNQVVRQMWWIILASIIFTTIIISAFIVTVRTLFNQKKISEIKSDFINNMTHELKTPLATISLAIDALTNEKVIHDAEKVKLYSSMIKEENKRMNKQVEKILQAARLEKEEIKLALQKLDAHQVISKVADNLALQIQERSGTLTLRLNASNPMIDADEVHFSNIIFNLLDNALKYSAGVPHIELETFSHGNGMISIKVKDNGIGMDKETQARIFEKFYRAHTGNLHNVKGFGLGLSYVKAIVDAHEGRIKVESAPGKGSSFTITLPQQG
ncbi:MAG: two-component sensor histidine kinase [Flavipsychrobacter sp.]|nr:two-component sensor histidine kinase [Flavipsychrobacter sp.]